MSYGFLESQDESSIDVPEEAHGKFTCESSGYRFQALLIFSPHATPSLTPTIVPINAAIVIVH